MELDAGSGVTTDGTDLVTGWSDLSGSGNDLTGSGDPRLVAGALNGQDVIRFDGEGDKLERFIANNLPTGNDDRTVFMVAKYNDNNGGAGGFTYGTTSKGKAFGLMVDNEGELGVQGWTINQDLRTTEVGVGAGWLTQSAVLNAGEAILYKDGTAIGTKNPTWDTTLDRIIVGAEFDNSPYLDIEVATVLVYDRALSDAERQEVESYLQNKYGLTGTVSNTAPVAVDDAITTDKSTAVTLDALADNGNGADSDADGDTLSITEVDSAAVTVDTPVTLTSGALVTLNTDGSFSYDPNGQFDALGETETGTDSFTYTIDDGNGGTATATVTITIDGATGTVSNTAPTASDDSFNIDADSTDNQLDVLANDTDPDGGDTLTITAVDITGIDPNSSVAVNSTNDGLIYTPASGLTGTETFSYTIEDSGGETSTATVMVDVRQANT